MVMITGGAYQGKTSYAVQNFNISEDDITDGKICAPETAMTARCIKNYHEKVSALRKSFASATERL